jgi:hypothetical protein
MKYKGRPVEFKLSGSGKAMTYTYPKEGGGFATCQVSRVGR